MLFLKMMSDEDLPDTSSTKGYTIIQLEDLEAVRFYKEDPKSSGDFNTEYPYSMSIERDSEVKRIYALKGNVYVMSERGKTIASFAVN